MPLDGVLRVSVSVNEMLGDTVPYVLRLNRPGIGQPQRETGSTALLTISTKKKNSSFTLLPLGRHAEDPKPWSVFATTYKVALQSDSLFELCQLPCSRPDTIKLSPGSIVRKSY